MRLIISLLGLFLVFLILFSCGGGGDGGGKNNMLTTEVVAKNWLITPHDLAFDSDGNLLVSANLDNRVAVLSASGELLYYYVLEDYSGQFMNTCVATTSEGDSYALNSNGLYRLDKNKTVTKLYSMSHYVTHMCSGLENTLFYTANFNGKGAFFRIQLYPTISIKQISSVDDTDLRGLDFGPDNNLYSFSANTGRIIKCSLSGSTSVFKSGFSHHGGPVYMAFTPDDTLFLADSPGATMYEIDLSGNVTVRDDFRAVGEMLFLPDKSYFTLNIYESILYKYDSQGTIEVIYNGQIGRSLVSMPNGSYMTILSDIGQNEIFPSGDIIPSSISDFSGVENTKYLFDMDGNTYFFHDNKLYSFSPLGQLDVVTEDLGCNIYYNDENIAFSEFDQAIYTTCIKDEKSVIMRYSINGQKTVFYENPHDASSKCIDIDIQGNIYYGYQMEHDFSYNLIKIDRDGNTMKILSKSGNESGLMAIACSKIGYDCYLIISPGEFVMYHISENGSVNQMRSNITIPSVDYQGLEASNSGDIYMTSPGILYRFVNSNNNSMISVSDIFQQITAEIGEVIDVVIPGNGFNDDTSVEAPYGCWVYEREVTLDSLSFKIAIREGSIPKEYDINLHNAGTENYILHNFLRIEEQE